MSRWPCVPKPAPGVDAVVVDHAQAAEAHVPRVVVLAERERVAAVEPAPVGLAALGGRSDGDHGFLLCKLVGDLYPQDTAPRPVIPRSFVSPTALNSPIAAQSRKRRNASSAPSRAPRLLEGPGQRAPDGEAVHEILEQGELRRRLLAAEDREVAAADHDPAAAPPHGRSPRPSRRASRCAPASCSRTTRRSAATGTRRARSHSPGRDGGEGGLGQRETIPGRRTPRSPPTRAARGRGRTRADARARCARNPAGAGRGR